MSAISGIRKEKRGVRRIGLPRLFVLLFFLLLFLPGSPAGGAESRTVLLPCAGGGDAGNRDGSVLDVSLLPASGIPDASGRLWTLAELQSLKGFRLDAAFLRFRTESVQGKKIRYALKSAEGAASPAQALKPGADVWDVTVPVRSSLASGAALGDLRFAASKPSRNRWVHLQEGSLSLQLTFSAEAPLPAFPLDTVSEEALTDASLCYLEQGHPILRRYQELTGSLTVSRWPLGVPYYFGGVNEEKILHRFFPRQVTGYYRADRMYLCGLDCAGFINLALQNCGLEPVSISDILKEKKGALLLNRRHPRYWPTFLRPGDLLAMRHGKFNHIALYLGTLRTYGWTEETAGEALPALDLPLVIHCGENPFYYQRYLEYIRAQGWENTFPPDGGVTVSVILPDTLSAPRRETAPWGDEFSWYLLEGTPLLAFPLQDCEDLAWFCP